jgi:hypothetical protein
MFELSDTLSNVTGSLPIGAIVKECSCPFSADGYTLMIWFSVEASEWFIVLINGKFNKMKNIIKLQATNFSQTCMQLPQTIQQFML